MNGAILELVTARLRRAEESGQPVYTLPQPKTREQAIGNLKAFSDEGVVDAEHPPRAGFRPFRPDAEINDCLGWAELDGNYVRGAAKRAGHIISATNESFFCIVYGLVEGKELEAERIIENGNFVHEIGFHNEPFNMDNWRGRGVLVDYGDIVPPLGCPRFYEPTYSMVRGWAEERVLELEKAGFF